MTRLAMCFGIAALLAAGCNRSSAPKSVDKVESMEPTAKVTAQAILAEYKANEVGADQKYKDKLIQVTGTVAAVKKDLFGKYFVGIGSPTEGDFYDVMCYLHESANEKAASLKIGSEAKLMGMCAGRSGGLVLTLKNCDIVK